MLDIDEFNEMVKQKNVPDEEVKEYFYKLAHLLGDDSLKLLQNCRPELFRKILKELMKSYIQKVTKSNL